MPKFENNIDVNKRDQIDYEWDGLVFKEAINYYVKKSANSHAVTIEKTLEWLSEEIGKIEVEKDKNICRSRWYEWGNEGSEGPYDKSRLLLLDQKFPNIRFMHRRCPKSEKEFLHGVYKLAWTFHNFLPLAVEADNTLKWWIDKCSKSENDKEAGQKLSNTYVYKLANDFYREYHQILEKSGVDYFHIHRYKGTTFLEKKVDDVFESVEWETFKQEYKELLEKREMCINNFENDLRTLLLGGDM